MFSSILFGEEPLALTTTRRAGRPSGAQAAVLGVRRGWEQTHAARTSPWKGSGSARLSEIPCSNAADLPADGTAPPSRDSSVQGGRHLSAYKSHSGERAPGVCKTWDPLHIKVVQNCLIFPHLRQQEVRETENSNAGDKRGAAAPEASWHPAGHSPCSCCPRVGRRAQPTPSRHRPSSAFLKLPLPARPPVRIPLD